MGRSRYRFGADSYPHFLTCTFVGWLPVFARPEVAQVVLDSLRFLQDRDRMTLLGYVVMEDHLHLIASAAELSREVGDFKSFTARRLLDLLHDRGARGLLDQLRWHKAPHKVDRPYQLWQEGSHPKMIENEPMLLQKLEYIHANPVWRGYVDDPTHWRYSSARTYARQGGLIPVTIDW